MSSVAEKRRNLEYDSANLASYLPIYYKFLFPFGPYYSWLSYGGFDKECMSHREFSFTLKDDIYLRYQSFTSQQGMEKEIQKAMPYKIDLGAIYTHPPKDHNKFHASSFKPIEKELVFDIDISDYDDVRRCCEGADICVRCWPLMTMAIQLLDRAFKDDFGFQHRLWVFSGRRGVHCWVCDENARRLPNKARSAIVDYLNVIQGGKTNKRVNLKDPVHPFLRHCITTISKNHWDDYRDKQDILGSEKDVEQILNMVPDADLCKDLAVLFCGANKSTESLWEKLKSATGNRYQTDQKKYKRLRYVQQEIMLEFCYPRLDANVTTSVNHLLKSPFCVHPKSGRICVPIDIDHVDEFDPFKVPTISQLCQELDSCEAVDAGNGQSKRNQLYRKTSLASYVTVFEHFVHNLLTHVKKERADNVSDSTDL